MTIRKSQLTFYLNRIRWEKTKNSDNETKMLIESRLSNNKHRTIRPWNPQRAFVTIIREIFIYKRKENKNNQSEGVYSRHYSTITKIIQIILNQLTSDVPERKSKVNTCANAQSFKSIVCREINTFHSTFTFNMHLLKRQLHTLFKM